MRADSVTDPASGAASVSDAELLDWIALNLLPGLGPLTLRRALEVHADPGRVAFALSIDALRDLSTRVRVDGPGLRRARSDLAERAREELRLCRRHGIRLVPRVSPGYPARLARLPDPPPLLHVRGDAGILGGAGLRVAMVGSRKATMYGRRVADAVAAGLVERGAVVVSGGARGIDACSHLGALEAGGETVAVIGSGLLRPYPAEHGALFDRIARQGALVSEFPLTYPPKPDNFPRRNRLVAGLADAVVVVEAGLRSGTQITAGHALDQGKDVFAVPGPFEGPQSAGCHALIRQGACLIHDLDDLLRELPAIRPPEDADDAAADPAARFADLDDDEREIVRRLDTVEPVHVDDLAAEVPFGVPRLQAALLRLELRGAADSLPGGYHVLRPP